MLSHLCPAVEPVLVQPHIPDPHLLHYRVFSSVLIRLPCCCLHSSPSCSSLTDPSSRSGSSSRSSNREQASSAPISISSSSPYSLSIQLCWLSGGPFSPGLSVHTGPSVPEPRSSVPGPRRKVEDGPCHSLPLLQGAPVPSVFPQPSVGALGHL